MALEALGSTEVPRVVPVALVVVEAMAAALAGTVVEARAAVATGLAEAGVTAAPAGTEGQATQAGGEGKMEEGRRALRHC